MLVKILSFCYFDFFLPEYNIVIEYDGEQHYTAINIFGGEKRLLEQRERDYRKKEICKINGIKLLYFTFKHDSFLGEKTYKTYNDLINEIKKLINEKN